MCQTCINSCIYTHIYLFINIYLFIFIHKCWIHTHTHTHKGVLFSLEKDFALCNMDEPKDITRSEISQTWTENKLHDLTYMWTLKKVEYMGAES